MTQNIKTCLYFEEVRRAPTFRNHFFFWLPVWVIISALLLVITRPATPYWRPDLFLPLWGIWSVVFILELLNFWSMVVVTEIYPDHLQVTLPRWSSTFRCNQIVGCEIDDTVRDNVQANRFPYYIRPPRYYVVHRHFAKGVRLYLSDNPKKPIFIESRHPKELLAALNQMLQNGDSTH